MPENKTVKPMSRVVVVSADALWREEVVAGLNAAAQKLDHPFVLEAVPAADGPQALAAVVGDGDVQIVLIDHGDHRESVPARGRGAPRPVDTATMAKELTAVRPELSLYVGLEDDENKLLLEELARNVVHG